MTHIILLSRGLERLLIVAAACLLVLLGYKLFKLGIESSQKAEISTGPFSVRLQSVAPGVFFAVLATALLVFSVTTQLEVPGALSVRPPDVDDATAGESGTIVWYARPPRMSDEDWVAEQRHLALSMSRLVEFSRDPKSADIRSRARIGPASVVVTNLRNEIICNALEISLEQLLAAMEKIETQSTDNSDPALAALVEQVAEWTRGDVP
jgi:hypothetical protein